MMLFQQKYKSLISDLIRFGVLFGLVIKFKSNIDGRETNQQPFPFLSVLYFGSIIVVMAVELIIFATGWERGSGCHFYSA